MALVHARMYAGRMMYGFGDDEHPLPETIACMQEVISAPQAFSGLLIWPVGCVLRCLPTAKTLCLAILSKLFRFC